MAETKHFLGDIQSYLKLVSTQDKNRQIGRWRRALQLAEPQDRDMMGEAINKLLPGPSCEFQSLLEILQGYVADASSRTAQALQHFHRVQELIPEPKTSGEGQLLFRAHLGMALCLTEMGEHHRAQEEMGKLDRLRDQAKALWDLKLEAALVQGLIWHHQGRNREAENLLQEAAKFSSLAEDELVVARLEDILGLVSLDLGKLDQAEMNFHRSLARKVRLGDRAGQAQTMGYLARFHAMQADFPVAWDFLTGQLSLCQSLGSERGTLLALQELARLAIRQKDWLKARQYLEEGEKLAAACHIPLAQGCQAFSWAEYYLTRGEWDEATRYHHKAESLFGEAPGDFVKANLNFQKARLAAGQGKDRLAETYFQESVQYFERINRPASLAQVEFAWGLWLQKCHRLDEALTHIAQAILWARELQAEAMAQEFAAVCRQIDCKYWLKALCEAKKLTQKLAEERARLEKFNGIEGEIHDLKNLFIAVKKDLEELGPKLGPVLHEGLQAKLNHALSMAEFMESWLTSLMQGFKAGDGILQPRLKPLPLAPQLEKLKEIFATFQGQSGFSLELPQVDPDLQVMADDRALISVLFNLVDNARKYAPGPVRVELESLSGQVKIKVIDQGQGIPEEKQDDIFRKWGRLEKERVTYSTGLGLYHAKKLVELMGGEIGVTSKVGHGSAFWFTLAFAH